MYLRHVHGGITARTMRSNMEMQSTVREGNEMMVEAMYGVMRDSVENGTLQAIRRVREVMRERPPEQDAALRQWGVTGAIESLESALTQENQYARRCLAELRGHITSNRNPRQSMEMVSSAISIAMVTYMRKVTNLLLEGRSVTEALLVAGQEVMRPHVTDVELRDLDYEGFLREIHWSVT